MACGDKYKYLIVTSSGLTPDDSGSDIPFFSGKQMYTEWYQLARKLSVEAHDRYVLLGDVEAQSDPSHPVWNSLVDLNNRMTSRFEDLPGPFWSIDRTADTARAQTVIGDAVCLMESADKGLAKYGAPVPVTPGPIAPKDDRIPWWVWALGGAGIVTVVGVTIAVMRRNRGRGQQAPVTVVIQEHDSTPAAAAA